MSELSFNVAEYENYSDSLPDGWYKVVINNFALTVSKAGVKYLQADYAVIQGDFNGRHIFDSFFTESGEYVASNRARVSKMAKACGIEHLRDTEQAVDKILWVKIKTKEGKSGTVNTNVMEYKPKDYTPVIQQTETSAPAMTRPAWAPKEA